MNHYYNTCIKIYFFMILYHFSYFQLIYYYFCYCSTLWLLQHMHKKIFFLWFYITSAIFNGFIIIILSYMRLCFLVLPHIAVTFFTLMLHYTVTEWCTDLGNIFSCVCKIELFSLGIQNSSIIISWILGHNYSRGGRPRLWFRRIKWKNSVNLANSSKK